VPEKQINEPLPDETRMYDDQVSGNPTVNETQVRRAGRLLDDQAAADALKSGDTVGAGSVQNGELTRSDADGDDTAGRTTASARNAQESKSRTGKTQNDRLGQV
jgi:hypothetical protein